MGHIFVSYSRRDRGFVSDLVRDLTAKPYAMDEARLRAYRLVMAIAVVWLLPASHNSPANANPSEEVAVPSISKLGSTGMPHTKDTQARQRTNSQEESGRPIIYGPTSSPAGIRPNQKTKVKFAAYIAGTKVFPNALFLHRVSDDGKSIDPPIAELRDNGKGGDQTPRDLNYGATVEIPSTAEGIVSYQLRLVHHGKSILSRVYRLPVTSLPIGIRPPDRSTLISNPGSRFRIFSNELAFTTGIDATVGRPRIEQIAQTAGGRVVGSWPPLQLYQVEIPTDPNDSEARKREKLNRALKAVSAFDEVVTASPNSETLPLAIPDTNPTDGAFPPCSGSQCQWYLEKVGALEAWRTTIGGTTTSPLPPPVNVAILEAWDHADFTHNELLGQGTQVTSCSTSCISGPHATQVAGIIAGKGDNTVPVGSPPGIVGVSYRSQVKAYFAYGATALVSAIDIASDAANGGARVVNISQELGAPPNLVVAIRNAIQNHGALIVAGGGQPKKIGGSCPTSGETTIVWPAQYNDIAFPDLRTALLSVGATDTNDSLAEWSVGGETFCTNRTPTIDLYSPGKDIYSTKDSGAYGSESGTSFAAALTSGAAAVLWSFNPSWTPQQVHDRLIQTANAIAAPVICNSISGSSPPLQCGRLNLANAVAPQSEVVLLFDTSGSMTTRPDGSSPAPTEEQRLAIAKSAAIPFVEMMNQFGAHRVKVGVARLPNPLGLPCNAEVISPMAIVNDVKKANLISSVIPGLSADGNTPMLAGLQASSSMFAIPESKRAVVLLSDGYHNCPSQLTPLDTAVTSLIATLNADRIRVFTIGFGRPTDVDHPLLAAIASGTTQPGLSTSQFYNVTGPTFVLATWHPATDLQATYKAILRDVLDLQSVTDPLGRIGGGQKTTIPIYLTDYDNSVMFYLSWTGIREGKLKFKITGGDGMELRASDVGVRMVEASTYTIVKVDREFLSLPGKVGTSPWRLEIDATSMSNTESVYYQYGVLADSDLKFNVHFDKQRYGTGDSPVITAQLIEDGRPLLKLKDIAVRVSMPGIGRGNWLGTRIDNQSDLKKFPDTMHGDTFAPVQKKAAYLTDVLKLRYPLPKINSTIALHDNGDYGDLVSTDGTYTAVLDKFPTDGTYTFHFHVTGLTSDGQKFQRDFTVQKYVSVSASLGASQFTIKTIVESKGVRQFVLILTPVDRLGNLLGPGYAQALRLEISPNVGLIDATDRLDGSYEFRFEIPQRLSDSEVSLAVRLYGQTSTFKLFELMQKSLSSGPSKSERH